MIIVSGTSGGLSWWQAWLCVWLGYSIAACFVVLTGRIGATYHISFPVVTRASFGIWGALWPVFNRAAMACIVRKLPEKCTFFERFASFGTLF
jgi:NCS1 family nucleobase:cation symporter-1